MNSGQHGEPFLTTRAERLRLDTYFLAALVLLALYYLAYRYPFQINSSTTSPTYSDTPSWLKFGKYLLFAGIAGIYAALRITGEPPSRIRWRHAADLFLGCYLCLYPMLVGVLVGSVLIIQTGIFFSLIPLFLLLRRDRIYLPRLSTVVSIFVYIAIGVEIAQLVLFITVGRLPGLAYRESLSVRFGSIWDDPNGWAVFTPFLLAFVAVRRFRGPRQVRALAKAALLGALAFMLLLSQSFTGIGAAVAGFWISFAILLTLRLRWRWLAIFALLTGMAATALVIVQAVMLPSPLFQAYWASKHESVAAHLGDLLSIRQATLGQLFGTRPWGEYAESGYVNIAVNLGIPYLLSFLAIGWMSISRLARLIVKYRGHEGVDVCYGAMFFLVTFYVAMVNLPMDTVFPVNLLAIICLLLSREEFLAFGPRVVP